MTRRKAKNAGSWAISLPLGCSHAAADLVSFYIDVGSSKRDNLGASRSQGNILSMDVKYLGAFSLPDGNPAAAMQPFRTVHAGAFVLDQVDWSCRGG